MDKKLIIGHLAVLTTTFIYGLNSPVMKFVMPEWITGYSLPLLREAFAAALFWLTSIFIHKDQFAWKDLLIIFIGAVLGLSANQIFYAVGLVYSSPVEGTIIRSFTPVTVFILAVIFLHRKMTWKSVAGIVIGAIGAALIVVFSSKVHSNPGFLKGNLLMLVSVIAYSCYMVLVEPLVRRYNVVNIMKWMFTFATFISLPFGIGDLVQAKVFHEPAPWTVYAAIAYSCFFATYVAYLVNVYALKYLSATVESLYSYIQPIITAFVAIVIFHQDRFNWMDPVSVLLIFLGFYLVIRSHKNDNPTLRHAVSTP